MDTYTQLIVRHEIALNLVQWPEDTDSGKASVGELGSPVGAWNSLYSQSDTAARYGDAVSYQLGSIFLGDCPSVQDWGSGQGYFRTIHSSPDRVTNVDGSESESVDTVVDLRSHRSSVDGIFMRHVLEHNLEWRAILNNATESASRKLFIAIYTPILDRELLLQEYSHPNVAELALPIVSIVEVLEGAGFDVDVSLILSNTGYGKECLLACSKREQNGS